MIGLFIFLFGLALGSFLNVIILRLGKKSFWTGRSECMKCSKMIVWFDNIPLLSFLFLRGKCRQCKNIISWQYPIIEFLTGVLLFWTYLLFGFTAQFFFYAVIISFLIVIFVYDLKHYLILDKVSIPAMIIAFIFNLYLGMAWTDLLLAGVIGSGFFAAQFFISRGKWIGGGDIRLGALMGFILGTNLVLVALMIAYLIGSVFGIALMALKKKELSSEVPFGPFLTTATLITMFYGLDILNWYFNILS